jgi:hypothetical protein
LCANPTLSAGSSPDILGGFALTPLVGANILWDFETLVVGERINGLDPPTFVLLR